MAFSRKSGHWPVSFDPIRVARRVELKRRVSAEFDRLDEVIGGGAVEEKRELISCSTSMNLSPKATPITMI